jgi:dolichyl-phosphate-mannose--protein O-mannosyl transferase
VFQTAPVLLLDSHCPSSDPVCSPQDSTSARRIVSIGNPVVWAVGTAALLGALLGALWWSDLRRALVAMWAAALWLPWVVRWRWAPWPLTGARPGYTFYAAPLVPVIAIALALGWHRLRKRWRTAIGVGLVAVMLYGAVALYPVWTARPTAPGYLSGLVTP